jgi:hypothetical protein
MLSRPTPLGPRRTAKVFILTIKIRTLTVPAEPMISVDLIDSREFDVVMA